MMLLMLKLLLEDVGDPIDEVEVEGGDSLIHKFSPRTGPTIVHCHVELTSRLGGSMIVKEVHFTNSQWSALAQVCKPTKLQDGQQI